VHPWAVEALASAERALSASYEREETPGAKLILHRWLAPEWDPYKPITPPLAGAVTDVSESGESWTFGGTAWCRVFTVGDRPDVLPIFKVRHIGGTVRGGASVVSDFVPVPLSRVLAALLEVGVYAVSALSLGELSLEALTELGQVGRLGGDEALVHALRGAYGVRVSPYRGGP